MDNSETQLSDPKPIVYLLTEQNFISFAINNYNNPTCLNINEIEEDLERIVYIKKLFRRYDKSGDLKMRLILNHLIIFYNVFGITAATRMLFFKLDKEIHSYLKTFLIFLNFLPLEGIPECNLTDIPMDKKIISILRNFNRNELV